MSLALAAAVSIPSYSQVVTPSMLPVANRGAEISEEEGYERMLKNQYKIELRALAGNAMNLSSEEMEDFTPIFMDYMKYKNSLVERRSDLVEDYKEEMREDDTPKDEAEETGDFIENYLEVDIADLELQKDYFDKFEDKIGYEKALRFFELEKMFQDRVNRTVIMRELPDLYMLEAIPVYSYSYEVDDFRNWKKINIDGIVTISHDFTSEGLEKLLNAAEMMTKAESISVDNFSERKQMVMKKADQLQKDWRSLKHADYAREAFVATADLLNDIAQDSRFIVRTEWFDNLDRHARNIEPSKKLTDQAVTVRMFFDTAEKIVNDLVDQANAVNK